MFNSMKFACLSCLILAGCSQSPTGEDASVRTAKATPLGVTPSEDQTATRSRESAERLIGGIKFEFPPDWEEKSPSNGMIMAEYSLPGAAGPGRLTFSTARGGTALNMDRWKNQFQRSADDPEPVESPLTVAGKDAAFIDVHGGFTDMFGGGGLKKDWQLLGVAIPLDPDNNYFVKLTGPSQTVSEHREQFLTFLKSARFE